MQLLILKCDKSVPWCYLVGDGINGRGILRKHLIGQ